MWSLQVVKFGVAVRCFFARGCRDWLRGEDGAVGSLDHEIDFRAGVGAVVARDAALGKAARDLLDAVALPGNAAFDVAGDEILAPLDRTF